MKLGLLYANVGAGMSPEGAAAVARHAEQAGFESLWTVEHVVVPAGDGAEYPYNSSRREGRGEGAPIPHPPIWPAYPAPPPQTVRSHDARLGPKPVHRRIPVVFGGHGEVAARRAGRLGDGFFPGRSRPEEVKPLLQVMRQAAEDAGRNPDAIELTLGAPTDRA